MEKPKPKEKVENKIVKKEVVSETKKAKKGKGTTEIEKPADFDEGIWEEVPKKSDKKKVKPEEKEKKESPVKKNKKKVKEADVEAAQPVEDVEQVETFKILSAEGPDVDDDVAKALQAQVEEVERVLREVNYTIFINVSLTNDRILLPILLLQVFTFQIRRIPLCSESISVPLVQ